MIKKLMSGLLTIVVLTGESQVTYTIPNPIPEFNGTIEAFGQNHLFYPNEGEVRYVNDDQSAATYEVQFYTQFTYTKEYLLSNTNLAFVFSKGSPMPSITPDSLHRIDLKMERGNTAAFLARIDTQKTAVLHYFTHWFGSGGRTPVEGGAAIAAQNIYPNIDMVYCSNNVGLKIFYIVYPGGDPNQIRLKFDGAKSTGISGNNLIVEANWDRIKFVKPQMYQYTYANNIVTPVNVCPASWQSYGSDMYGAVTTSTWNPSLPLIIQVSQGPAVTPAENGLCWSTYFGGWQFEFLTKTHCDASDNLYVAGYSNSVNLFPQLTGVITQPNNGGDGVVAKFNSAGVLQWSNFIGGSSTEEIRDFEVVGNKIFCVGKTGSTDLVTVAKTGATNDGTFGGPLWDGFICEFEYKPATANFQNNWFTYYGGNGDEELNACKFDVSGNLFVVGESASTNLSPLGSGGAYQQSFNSSQLNPNTNAPLVTDAIIAKFNTSSSQTWFTFFGTDVLGTNAHNHPADYFYGLDIDGTDLYACGKSGGTNLPNAINSKIVNGNFDGILAHFTTSGVLNNAKYTDGNIANYAVKVNGSEVYSVGQANSSMNAVNSGLHYYNNTSSGTTDACFSVHNQNLSSTTHNSFLGGSSDDAAYDIQFTSNNLFLIAGGTNSSNFPVTTLGSLYNSSAQGVNDNFIACFQKNSTSIIWSSYLGSTFQESLLYPEYFNSQHFIANSTISLDSQNKLRLLGTTSSYNTFPLDNGGGVPYFQSTLGGGFANDATITCFDIAAITSIVGLNDFENTEFVFGLYPNPTSSFITITNSEISNVDLRYCIYDISGKKLKENYLKASEVKNIDVSFLPEGVYVINVTNGAKTFSNKFIKTEN